MQGCTVACTHAVDAPPTFRKSHLSTSKPRLRKGMWVDCAAPTSVWVVCVGVHGTRTHVGEQ